MMGGYGKQWASPGPKNGYDPRFEEGPDSAMRLNQATVRSDKKKQAR